MTNSTFYLRFVTKTTNFANKYQPSQHPTDYENNNT